VGFKLVATLMRFLAFRTSGAVAAPDFFCISPKTTCGETVRYGILNCHVEVAKQEGGKTMIGITQAVNGIACMPSAVEVSRPE
jgi:hypothetical protein